ncbi:MAG TPA: AgmX/PglI C-terminal domain-containing protein, partial [Sandaracinaceae bacterium LLY-WYZ-13_1]|nr:AgmX/PglI C-terminal domain-containing protein [Sandaracinaceae bacterium LLY-WYZ-13_1]
MALRRRRERGAAREAAVRERRVASRGWTPIPDAPPLDPAAVRAVVQAAQGRLRQCYTTAVRREGRGDDARVRLAVSIAPAGHVASSTVAGPDFGGMHECLRRTADRWTFPESRAGGHVPIPLAFEAVD